MGSTIEIANYPPNKRKLRVKPFGASRVHKILTQLIHWTLFLYAFLLPLETIELGFATRGALTLPKMAAIALVGLSVLCRKIAFRRFEWPHLCFAGYVLAILMTLGTIPLRSEGQVLSLFVMLIQLFVIFWLASNLLTNERTAKGALLAFSIGCSVLALCALFNIGGMTAISRAKGLQRLTIDGFDPNEIAYILALGIAALIGIFLENGRKSAFSKVAIIGLALPQVAMLISAGSRTGLAALVMGIMLFVVFMGKRRNKIIVIFVCSATLLGVCYLALTNPVTASRLQDTVEEGHLSGRGLIYSSALDMIDQKPFWGWGPVESQYELGTRTGRGRVSPHNLYLRVLLQVGLLGGGLFFIGLALCVKSAWRGRIRTLGLTPFVLLSIVLIVNLGLDYLTRKVTWFVLALVVAQPHIGIQYQAVRSKIRHKTCVFTQDLKEESAMWVAHKNA